MTHGTSKLRGKRALVVDDMATIRHILMAILKNEGCECAGASNGAVALELLSRRTFHVVLCDWNMPGMNGIEFIKEVRKLAPYRFMPILFQTTESQQSKRLEAKAAGASGWLVKPVTATDLLNTIKLVMR